MKAGGILVIYTLKDRRSSCKSDKKKSPPISEIRLPYSWVFVMEGWFHFTGTEAGSKEMLNECYCLG